MRGLGLGDQFLRQMFVRDLGLGDDCLKELCVRDLGLGDQCLRNVGERPGSERPVSEICVQETLSWKINV